MKIRALFLALSLSFAGVVGAKTTAPVAEAKAERSMEPTHDQAQAALWVQRFLTRLHYKPVELDDAMSAKIFKRYLESLDGDCAESALVGNDGMLGVSLFMSDGPSSGYASVLATGEAYRIPAGILKREFDRAGDTMRVLLRYTQALLTQTAQHAICARHHLITQQVAFCLLQQSDRSQSHEVLMTQEQIATRLGVRREGVTEGAGHLQKLGLIRYSRGHVEILDRDGLEDQACECYSVLRNEYQRLLPAAPCQECLLAA